MTVIGLITEGDDQPFREETEGLKTWCHNNNLELNTTKTKELIIDFRRKQTETPPLLIKGTPVERVSSFKFLGVHMSNQLTWTFNTAAIIKKTQQCLHFLRLLKRNNLEEKLLVTFYSSAMKNMNVSSYSGR